MQSVITQARTDSFVFCRPTYTGRYPTVYAATGTCSA